MIALFLFLKNWCYVRKKLIISGIQAYFPFPQTLSAKIAMLPAKRHTSLLSWLMCFDDSLWCDDLRCRSLWCKSFWCDEQVWWPQVWSFWCDEQVWSLWCDNPFDDLMCRASGVMSRCDILSCGACGVMSSCDDLRCKNLWCDELIWGPHVWILWCNDTGGIASDIVTSGGQANEQFEVCWSHWLCIIIVILEDIILTYSGVKF